jgi:micrococcal nuclease
LATRFWSWFRARRVWVQALLWLFFWGPLAAIWLVRRGGCLWIALSVVPILCWIAFAVTVTVPSSPLAQTPALSSQTTATRVSNISPTTINTSAQTTPTRPLASLHASPIPTATPTADAGFVPATVIEVIDGDTIRVSIDGRNYTVRLIGVDTPEIHDPRQPVMCYGREATAFTTEMIRRANNRVLLEKDVSETDKYGRLLRYVWLEHPDGRRMLNYELLSQGYAQVATYPPDVRYADWFLQAQREARDQGRGLWTACGAFGVPAASPTPTAPSRSPSPPQQQPGRGRCDPSYPDVCIPPPPPDLDCSDIPYRRFRVLPPDPHGFDRNGDGIGCER